MYFDMQLVHEDQTCFFFRQLCLLHVYCCTSLTPYEEVSPHQQAHQFGHDTLMNLFITWWYIEDPIDEVGPHLRTEKLVKWWTFSHPMRRTIIKTYHKKTPLPPQGCECIIRMGPNVKILKMSFGPCWLPGSKEAKEPGSLSFQKRNLLLRNWVPPSTIWVWPPRSEFNVQDMSFFQGLVMQRYRLGAVRPNGVTHFKQNRDSYSKFQKGQDSNFSFPWYKEQSNTALDGYLPIS